MRTGKGGAHADRRADRWGRLPGPERGDPCWRSGGEGVYGNQLVGFRLGWSGLMEGHRAIALTIAGRRWVRSPRGDHVGNVVRTRSRPPTVSPRCSATLERDGVDALIAIGGDDTLGVAARLGDEGSTWSACPRRSTTISPRPTTRSASGPRCRCDRRDRPAADDGRESRPGDGRRGDGPACRLDRIAPVSPAVPTSSWFPRSRSTSRSDRGSALARHHARGRVARSWSC